MIVVASRDAPGLSAAALVEILGVPADSLLVYVKTLDTPGERITPTGDDPEIAPPVPQTDPAGTDPSHPDARETAISLRVIATDSRSVDEAKTFHGEASVLHGDLTRPAPGARGSALAEHATPRDALGREVGPPPVRDLLGLGQDSYADVLRDARRHAAACGHDLIAEKHGAYTLTGASGPTTHLSLRDALAALMQRI